MLCGTAPRKFASRWCKLRYSVSLFPFNQLFRPEIRGKGEGDAPALGRGGRAEGRGVRGGEAQAVRAPERGVARALLPRFRYLRRAHPHQSRLFRKARKSVWAKRGGSEGEGGTHGGGAHELAHGEVAQHARGEGRREVADDVERALGVFVEEQDLQANVAWETGWASGQRCVCT